MIIELLKTDDGSYTFYNPILDETYHSRHGANQESAYVFIKQGLDYYKGLNKNQKQINIYELGFGTGLNAILSFQSKTNGLFYYSIEKHPIEKKLHLEWLKLNKLNCEINRQIIDAEWNTDIGINANTIHKANADVFDFNNTDIDFDIVYFDAFGFRVQEAMWQENICQYFYTKLKKGGILVTYASKGSFRRNLEKVGFKCEKLPGPPGKREMLRATKV